MYLFRGGPRFPCEWAADANVDDLVDMSDAINILSFLFMGGPPLPAPFPQCGLGPSCSGALGCESYPWCQREEPSPRRTTA